MGKKTKMVEKKKLCFVVGPIGDDDSDKRIHADWLLEEIIQPVFDTDFPDFKVERADGMANPGLIDAQMVTALLDAELVIADLTTLNPNAFYEIGIRHTINRPIIHMHLDGESIPFDVSTYRSIKFSRERPRDLRVAREKLKQFVAAATAEGFVVENPVTSARGRLEFDKRATPAEKLMQDTLDAMAARLSTLEMQSGRPPMWMPGGGGLTSLVNRPKAEFLIAQPPEEISQSRDLGELVGLFVDNKIHPKEGVRLAFTPREPFNENEFKGFVTYQMIRVFESYQKMTAVNGKELVFRVSKDKDVATGRKAIMTAARAARIPMDIEIRE